MGALRLQTPEEATQADMFEQHYPDPKKFRWHCTECGRFASQVRKVPVSGPDWVDEGEYTGECKTHGRVDVTWPEM